MHLFSRFVVRYRKGIFASFGIQSDNFFDFMLVVCSIVIPCFLLMTPLPANMETWKIACLASLTLPGFVAMFCAFVCRTPHALLRHVAYAIEYYQEAFESARFELEGLQAEAQCLPCEPSSIALRRIAVSCARMRSAKCALDELVEIRADAECDRDRDYPMEMPSFSEE